MLSIVVGFTADASSSRRFRMRLEAVGLEVADSEIAGFDVDWISSSSSSSESALRSIKTLGRWADKA